MLCYRAISKEYYRAISKEYVPNVSTAFSDARALLCPCYFSHPDLSTRFLTAFRVRQKCHLLSESLLNTLSPDVAPTLRLGGLRVGQHGPSYATLSLKPQRPVKLSHLPLEATEIQAPRKPVKTLSIASYCSDSYSSGSGAKIWCFLQHMCKPRGPPFFPPNDGKA